MSGTLDVLNCKLGELKLSFDKSNPIEAERARRAVTQMLRDGFVIFVEVKGKLRRVESFDESCDCYVISDVPGAVVPSPAKPTPQKEVANAPAEPELQPTRRGRGRKQRVAAGTTRATAVAPRAGG